MIQVYPEIQSSSTLKNKNPLLQPFAASPSRTPSPLQPSPVDMGGEAATKPDDLVDMYWKRQEMRREYAVTEALRQDEDYRLQREIMHMGMDVFAKDDSELQENDLLLYDLDVSIVAAWEEEKQKEDSSNNNSE